MKRHTLLLAEDEPFVLTVMQRLLQKLGYEVVSFANPVAAAAYARSSAPPSMLITDIIMPHMNGFELCDVLRARFPGLPVIFMSGYPLENLPDTAVSLPDNSILLAKPFGIHEMRDTIAELLSRGGVSSRV